ncbi:MAG: acetylxylan esterase, partial [Pirellulaceae bacterium]|nr:acetylxylan esterase [Pirellulaceae bacterium]
RAHRFANQPKENEVTDEGWLLFSPLAESHSQSVPGLQTLTGMRGVDFLLSLPEVDPARIAITGASGGGTQSFITAAVDPRIALSFPAVMVSTGMQGGCTCESSSLLRTGTGNVEMAGLIAPRPLGMTAANDWTKTMPTDGFPELQKLYGMFGAKENVALFAAVHFPHNYNHVARVGMYGWVNKHFKLGFKEPVLERDFEWKGKDDLHVWDSEHPKPESGEGFERKLMKRFRDNIDAQYAELLASGKQKELREILLGGWQVCLGLTNGAVEKSSAQPVGDLTELTSSSDGKWQVRQATDKDSALKVTVSGGAGGKSQVYSLALVGQSFKPTGEVIEVKEQPLVGNPRLAAAYTYGYNQPLVARRARQLGATLQWLAAANPGATLTVEGHGPAAAVAAGGAVVAQELKVSAVQLKLAPAGFRFAKVDSIRDPSFLPASARYMDLPGLVRCFQGTVELIGEDKLAAAK